MFKARIKETGEIAEFSTGKNLQGETILLKVGTASFFKPEEVENIDQIGWHPASELPPLKTIGKPHTEPRQYKESDYIIFVTKNGLTLIGKYGEYPYKENVTGTWGTDYNKKFNSDNKGLCFEQDEILCWCNLPKEIKE